MRYINSCTRAVFEMSGLEQRVMLSAGGSYQIVAEGGAVAGGVDHVVTVASTPKQSVAKREAGAQAGEGLVEAWISMAKRRFGKGESVIVTMTIANNSKKTIRVLKVYTPFLNNGEKGSLGALFNWEFYVTKNGKSIQYRGVMGDIAGRPTDAASYLMIRPGHKASASIDLATAYDLSQPGEYQVRWAGMCRPYVGFTTSPLETASNLWNWQEFFAKRVVGFTIGG